MDNKSSAAVSQSKTVSQVKHKAGHFGFSAAKIADLDNTEYTLVTIVADHSLSTSGFQTAMEECLKKIIKACQHSPRSENLLIRLVIFNHGVEEIHGYRPLSECNLDDYDGTLPPSGSTALHDATIDAVEASGNYGQLLDDQDFMANGLVVVITDGQENDSKFKDVAHVRQAFEDIIKGEKVESLISILVAVNPGADAPALDKFHKEGGFDQYVELKDSSESTFAKLAQFISQSISSQSQALGSGGPSTPINPSTVF